MLIVCKHSQQNSARHWVPAEVHFSSCARKQERGEGQPTFHVSASVGLLNVLGATRAFLRLPLDERKTGIFLFDTVLDSRSVLLAGLVLVPRAIAWDAGFGAALVAFKDVCTTFSTVGPGLSALLLL